MVLVGEAFLTQHERLERTGSSVDSLNHTACQSVKLRVVGWHGVHINPTIVSADGMLDEDEVFGVAILVV
jgi:hypothetical protein